MKLRIRHPQGTATVDILDNATVADLEQAIQEQTGSLPDELRSGFPPRSIDTSDPNKTLSAIGIRNGDQIIVTGVKTAPAASIRSDPIRASTTAPTQSASALANSHAEAISVDGGYVVMREMEDDNSCLFRSIGYVLERSVDISPKLRHVIASAIRNDPESYPDVVLGRPRDTYIQAILQPNTWGGAIELAILSKHYRTEICSVDVATSRIDQFGHGEYTDRVVVIYSGIHYDALALTPDVSAPKDFDTTVFSVTEETGFILQAATQLAARLKARHYYTDTANFSLKCLECGTGLIGEKEARAHAEQTAHVRFGEY